MNSDVINDLCKKKKELKQKLEILMSDNNCTKEDILAYSSELKHVEKELRRLIGKNETDDLNSLSSKSFKIVDINYLRLKDLHSEKLGFKQAIENLSNALKSSHQKVA